MAKYRKKPVVVEAVQWTGKNEMGIALFMHGKNFGWYGLDLQIYTHAGIMSAKVGDYIIKGVNGEFYPCKPDIFEKTYERVEEE